MSKIIGNGAAVAFALALVPAAALADTPGVVTTDLNLREGPSPTLPVVETIPAGDPVTIEGCSEDGRWCQVDYRGESGWVASNYLAVTQGGTTVVVSEQPSLIGEVISAPLEATGAVVGGVAGAVGSVVGGVADAITPDQQVVTYVERNPRDVVYIDGEVVVGATVPETVEIVEIPDSDYRYAYINDEPVLIEPESRRVVYVVR